MDWSVPACLIRAVVIRKYPSAWAAVGDTDYWTIDQRVNLMYSLSYLPGPISSLLDANPNGQIRIGTAAVALSRISTKHQYVSAQNDCGPSPLPRWNQCVAGCSRVRQLWALSLVSGRCELSLSRGESWRWSQTLGSGLLQWLACKAGGKPW